MELRYAPSRGHHCARQPQHQWHQGAAQNLRRSRVEKLPDDGNAFHRRSHGGLRIRQAGYLNEINPSVTNHAPQALYVTREVQAVTGVYSRISGCTQPCERQLYEVDASITETARCIAFL